MLSDCFEAVCNGTSFPARTYSLGRIALHTDAPTPSKRSTWGQVKQLYR